MSLSFNIIYDTQATSECEQTQPLMAARIAALTVLLSYSSRLVLDDEFGLLTSSQARVRD
jgi:hypothetical protein